MDAREVAVAFQVATCARTIAAGLDAELFAKGSTTAAAEAAREFLSQWSLHILAGRGPVEPFKVEVTHPPPGNATGATLPGAAPVLNTIDASSGDARESTARAATMPADRARSRIGAESHASEVQP